MKKKLNKEIKLAILSLDTMPQKTYDRFSQMGHLQNKSYMEIWSHYPMVRKPFNPKTMVKETSIIEPYLLLQYLKKENVNCRFWYNNSLFIYNDELYRIIGKDVVKVDLDGVYYFSFRESFAHPFFSLFEQILEKNGGKLCKPNKATMRNTGCMNKMYAINELYSNRDKYIQDLIVPFNIKPTDYTIFMQFIKDNLGDKVVFKNDCIQEGKGVIFKNLSEDLLVPEIRRSIDIHKHKQKELLIAPAYTIENEYRCYFTNYADGAKVFAIKQRVNTTDEKEFYSKDNIHINVNMKVKWLEIKNNSDIFKYASKIAYEMIELMSYDTGCLEFAITDEGKIVFFEVNQMAGPLPFEGEDCENMNDYYISMFDEMVR
ncbi:MAG: hypothetical protein U9Q20_02235 [Campylobacterota bacterium]|nr:hypothetical protein [Campylobacterota bacterium]